jgi:hypothetical protein
MPPGPRLGREQHRMVLLSSFYLELPVTHDELAALVAGFSKPRLEVYLLSVAADPDRAWELIQWEQRVAASMWTEIANCELVVRNAINRSLQDQAGTLDWHDQLPRLGVHGADRRRIDEVIQRLVDEHRVVTVDRVVANLTFTFWTNLVSSAYDRTLWRNGLADTFGRAPRRDIHAGMERVKTLRNAIAHHQVLVKDSRSETSNERLERGVAAIHRLIRLTTLPLLADKLCTAQTKELVKQRPA